MSTQKKPQNQAPPPGKAIAYAATPGQARIEYTIDGVTYETTVSLMIEAVEHVGAQSDGSPALRWAQRTTSETRRIGMTPEAVMAAAATANGKSEPCNPAHGEG